MHLQSFNKYPRFWVFGSILMLIAFSLLGFDNQQATQAKWDEDTPLSEVLKGLGAEPRLHAIESVDSSLAARGREIVTQGRTTKPSGKQTSRQSKFYTCTDCHNIQQENPDLSNLNPEDRLQFAMENDIPFLQGTTLYGVVNRETWYNGGYQEKYGNLAKDAKDTLRNAIQLCATECSQGRLFTDWELKAVTHFLWSIQLKLGDLQLSGKMMAKLNKAKADPGKQKTLIDTIKERYYTKSPATFVDALPADERKYGEGGNPKLGKAIYEKSCRQCHQAGGPTRFTLDYSTLTFNKLVKHFDEYNENSIYQVIRYGTSPRKGYRPYMPHYPIERMSREQVNHLAAFIRQEASIKF